MTKEFSQPLFSVVVLNWNGSKYVYKCLESVINQTYKNVEVIFVDNFSSDESLKECKKRFPSFIFIENKCNKGFTGGMNIGISATKGKYILLLNTDVYLEQTYIESCVELLEANPNVACTAGWEYKWRNYILTEDKVSGGLGILLHLRLRSTNKNFNDVFGVTGSFPVFRKTSIEEIVELRGFFFDETFETGWEDTEIRFLMFNLKQKSMLNTNTRAWHVGSASDNEKERLLDKNPNYQVRIFRNRLYIIDRYIKGIYPGWYIYLCLVDLALSGYLFLFHRNSFKLLKRAKVEFHNNSEHSYKQRSIISNINKANRNSILRYIIGL